MARGPGRRSSLGPGRVGCNGLAACARRCAPHSRSGLAVDARAVPRLGRDARQRRSAGEGSQGRVGAARHRPPRVAGCARRRDPAGRQRVSVQLGRGCRGAALAAHTFRGRGGGDARRRGVLRAGRGGRARLRRVAAVPAAPSLREGDLQRDDGHDRRRASLDLLVGDRRHASRCQGAAIVRVRRLGDRSLLRARVDPGAGAVARPRQRVPAALHRVRAQRAECARSLPAARTHGSRRRAHPRPAGGRTRRGRRHRAGAVGHGLGSLLDRSVRPPARGDRAPRALPRRRGHGRRGSPGRARHRRGADHPLRERLVRVPGRDPQRARRSRSRAATRPVGRDRRRERRRQDDTAQAARRLLPADGGSHPRRRPRPRRSRSGRVAAPALGDLPGVRALRAVGVRECRARRPRPP